MDMKRIVFIALILTLTNCDSRNSSSSYSFRVVDKGNVKLMPIRIDKRDMAGSSFSFVYIDQNRDTTRFELSSSENGMNYLIQKKDTTKLTLKDKRSYTIGNKEYDIYKLYGNEDKADGLLVYFWCPEFGILLSRIPNWRESKFLLCNEKSNECETIQILQQLIMTDFFSVEEPRSEIDFVEPKVEN